METVRDGRDLLERDPVLRRIVEVIVKEIDPNRIILFGSRARGDYKEDSDYDILVLKEGVRPEDRRPLQKRIRRALWNENIYSSAAVDVIVQDVERFNRLKNEKYLVYYTISREGVVIYEKALRKAMA